MKCECSQVPEARAVLPANLQRLHRGPDPVFRAAWVGKEQRWWWGGGAAGQRRQHLVEPNNITSGSKSLTEHTRQRETSGCQPGRRIQAAAAAALFDRPSNRSARPPYRAGGGGGGTPPLLPPPHLSFWVRRRRSFVHKIRVVIINGTTCFSFKI